MWRRIEGWFFVNDTSGLLLCNFTSSFPLLSLFEPQLVSFYCLYIQKESLNSFHLVDLDEIQVGREILNPVFMSILSGQDQISRWSY